MRQRFHHRGKGGAYRDRAGPGLGRHIGREQEERYDEQHIPGGAERPDKTIRLARRGIERKDRLEAKQRPAGPGVGQYEAGHQDEADQPADIAQSPASAAHPPELTWRCDMRHQRIVEHGGEPAGDRGDEHPAEDDPEIERGGAGTAYQSIPCPTTKRIDHQKIIGLSRPGVGHRAEQRSPDGNDDGGSRLRITPDRSAASGIANDDIGEIGREQEDGDERIERLRGPVEQHPGGNAQAPSLGRRRGLTAHCRDRHRRPQRSTEQVPGPAPAI